MQNFDSKLIDEKNQRKKYSDLIIYLKVCCSLIGNTAIYVLHIRYLQ
jgi:hypothetical protein